jgi:hypothetical protein
VPIIQTHTGKPLAVPLRAANVKGRTKRNAFPIHGYTGANGGGKTMAAVYDSLPTLAAGRPVVSSCRILDPATGLPHPLWVPLDDYRIIPELRLCDLIFDEVTGLASARDSASMPSTILNELMQLRKDDVTIRWTTPNWKRADTGIREVTQALTTCTGFAPSSQRTVTDDGLVRQWRQRRGFLWRTYDAKNFDEWTQAKERSSSKSHRIRPIARQVFWGPGSLVHDCYDTYETALTLGAVSDHGMCLDCGGNRPRKKCTCDPDTPVDAPSAGMRLWRELDRARSNRMPTNGEVARLLEQPELHLIPETDDTPGVVVELAHSD